MKFFKLFNSSVIIIIICASEIHKRNFKNHVVIGKNVHGGHSHFGMYGSHKNFTKKAQYKSCDWKLRVA